MRKGIPGELFLLPVCSVHLWGLCPPASSMCWHCRAPPAWETAKVTDSWGLEKAVYDLRGDAGIALPKSPLPGRQGDRLGMMLCLQLHCTSVRRRGGMSFAEELPRMLPLEKVQQVAADE